MGASGLSPEELGVLAHAEPSIAPRGLAKAIYVISVIFLVWATLVIVLRVYVRAWLLAAGKAWGADDILAVLGYVSFVFSFGLPDIVFCLNMNNPSLHYVLVAGS